jgi:hypothetical protein
VDDEDKQIYTEKMMKYIVQKAQDALENEINVNSSRLIMNFSEGPLKQLRQRKEELDRMRGGASANRRGSIAKTMRKKARRATRLCEKKARRATRLCEKKARRTS